MAIGALALPRPTALRISGFRERGRLAGMNFKNLKIVSASRRNQQASRLCSPIRDAPLQGLRGVGPRAM